MDLAPVGLVEPGDEPQQGRLAGAVGADEADLIAGGDGRIHVIEDDEVADLANDALQPYDRHQAGPPDAAARPAAGAVAPPRAAARRAAAALRVAACAARALLRRRSGRAPPRRTARSSAGRAGPRRRRLPPPSPTRRSQKPARRLALLRRQPLAPRAEVRRSPADDDPADRPAAALAGLAGALVDGQMLLHRAVAFRSRVVVDRAAPPLDRLGQDVAERLVQPADVVGAKRVGVPERVEPRPPERSSA